MTSRLLTICFFLISAMLISPVISSYAGDFSEVKAEKKVAVAPYNSNASKYRSSKGGGITGDIFGRRRKSIHPFISITETFSDNIYSRESAKESDLISLLSFGAWGTYPASNKQPVNIRVSNVAPGGSTFFKTNPLRRKNKRLYLMYRQDHEFFSSNSSENTDSQTAIISFQYKRGKSHFKISDNYVKSHDKRGDTLASELGEYKSNLIVLDYDFIKSRKFRYSIGYSIFSPDYQATSNGFRNRKDKTIYGSIYYRFMPKTSCFIQYNSIEIAYKNQLLLNNREDHLLAGLTWDVTAKSKGTLRAGYGNKKFENSNNNDHSTLFASLELSHKVSSKTRLNILLSRRTNETNIYGYASMLSNNLSLSMKRNISSKSYTLFGTSYLRDKYMGSIVTAGPPTELVNTTLRLHAEINHRFNNVFKASAGYSRIMRSSNASGWGYSGNEIYIRLSAAI